MSSFVHLHVHSQYSILDGQASIRDLVNKALADKMPAIALTDHGNMFGIKEFHNYIKKSNKKSPQTPIKPIIGCEVYVARNGKHLHRKEVKEDARGWHLILLAKNFVGYKNLIKIVSRAWTDGYYYCPRTDHKDLETYSEGLIACSACLGGEIPAKILHNNLEEADQAVAWFKKVFGDDFYLELQRHQPSVANAAQDTYPKQQLVNQHLIELARKHEVKLIATNDVHFVDEDHAEAHHRLICLNTGNDVDDYSKMAYTKQEWFKTTEEMQGVFQDLPEALQNTLEIANKVEYYDINHEAIMPDFPKPEAYEDDNEYLRHLTYKGAEKVYPNMDDEVRERLEFELDVIKNMGYPGYFLIVQDITTAARDMGVAVGPGRGSAAGSAVAYCLGITKVDPIKYGLLFERFLNPERISMPDIDIDFDDDGRNAVLHWVEERYGKEKVAHIITFGTMASKSAIKDVARVQKLPLSESERLSKLIPDKIIDPADSQKRLKVNLKNSIDYVPELKEAAESDDPVLRDTMKYAQQLEGTVRNMGVHPCGIIIGRDEISDWVPVSTAEDKETGEKLLVTQYEGSVIEATGLIKMDFLGLKTLSIIKDAVDNIYLSRGIKVDIDNISLEDEKTYALYSAGKTIGTFQFESPGMQKYLRDLQPSKLEDLIAMNALYRPGPMDYIPQFIARKQGKEAIEYDIPVMESYLKDTYGITVYQEQVMLLSRLLAGFSRGESDELRKAMGKKQREVLDVLKPKFIEEGKKNAHDEATLNKIWLDWEKFADYAFNKSHATCYSLLSYQTAWLKANYPSEYMAAVLSRSINNISDVTKFMDECRAMDIQVLGPDINESHYKFTVNKQGNIRFGLGAIKGMGESAVKAIIEERANQNYVSVFDLVERVNLNACTRKNIEVMALAGAFDSLEDIQREQFFAENDRGEVFLDLLMRYGSKIQLDKAGNNNTLFGEEMEMVISRPEIPKASNWSEIERLNREKEYVGMYISSHPLDEYSVFIKYVCNITIEEIKTGQLPLNKDLQFAGIVTEVRERRKQNGDPYAFVTIEDYTSSIEVPFWSREYVDFGKYLKKDMFLAFKGVYQPRPWKTSENELKINSISLLSEAASGAINKIQLTIPLHLIDADFNENLLALINKKPGKSLLYITVYDPETQPKLYASLFSRNHRIQVDKEIIDFLEENSEIEIKIN